MIIDQISNAYLYTSLSPEIKRAFDYIQGTDLLTLRVGEHELDGRNFYVVVQQHNTKLPDQGRWEAHRRYIDLHYMVQGTERIGYAPLSRMKQGAYDGIKDFLALSGTGDFMTLKSGDFMLLWNDEGHMPGMAVDSPSMVNKIVVKIRIG